MLLDTSPGRSLGFPPRHWLDGVARPKTLLRRLHAVATSIVLEHIPDHRSAMKKQYSHRELATWLNDTGGELLKIERWRVWTEEHWTARERLPRATPARPDQPHQLACLRIRRVP